ncbi:hypothetical protein ACM39_04300 [Chryseobacterium sp. FH2]|uniref:hypothetical protein n=1 Tax=Chryseobacterium sp. FH2 TaxID=1674291 RepID=UPI00065AEAAC|nr:hypothetical protein [Chryseobacterium sp. FH2]KMQ69314.1 hypothetical protein ACM39_04300 [Chryseobacterium sp. FH2]
MTDLNLPHDKNILWKRILIAFFGLAFIILLIVKHDLVIDDSFITFQYSKNFAEHFKPWYNLDPEYQGNGQTSLLWMWILAFFAFIHIKPEDSFIIINSLLGLFLIYKLVSNFDFKGNIFSKIFNISFGIFFTFWLYLNSTHGLESVLALVILYQFLTNFDSDKNYYSMLLPLVRPEFALFQVFYILNSKLFSRDFFKKLAISSLGIIVFAGFYLAFFDFYIPLPFLLKSRLSNYSFAVTKVFIGYLVLFSPVLIQFFEEKKYLKLLPLIILLYYYTFHVNSYSSGIYIRYLFPLIVYFLFFNSITFQKRWTVIKKILLIASALRMFDLSTNFYQNMKLDVRMIKDGFDTSYKEWMKHLTKSDKVSIMDAGYIAYYSPSMTYDGYGLNDAKFLLAVKNRDRISYKSYFDKKNINQIALASTSPKKFVARSSAEEFIYKTLTLEKREILYIYPMDPGYYLFVYKTR